MQKYLPVLRNCPFFTGLTDDEILSILHCVSASKITRPRGSYIFRAGDSTEVMGLVLSGSTLVIQEDLWGHRNILSKCNTGDFFGEPYAATPGAITFEEREAPAYDEAAVQENKKKKELQEKMKHLHEGGCPGSRMRMLEQPEAAESAASAPVQPVSRLRNWPVQIKLAPVHAPYFEGAKLLIAADCTAYAYANFHQEFMRGKVTLIGCPKLDAVDYSEKLTEILRSNDIQSVTILRMEVPCCGGLEMAAKKALQTSGKFIPWQVVTISIDGKILD